MKFLVERLVLKGVAIGSFKKYIDCHYRMYLLFSLYIAALFVTLTPGVLLRIPKGGSKLTVAVVHGLVFAVLYCLTKELVSRTFYADGFQSSNNAPRPPPSREALEARNRANQQGEATRAVMAARRRFEDLQQKANQAKVDSRAARAAFMSASASARAALRTAAAAAEARWAAANTAAMTAAAEVKAVEVRAAAAMAAVAEQRAAARRAWM